MTLTTFYTPKEQGRRFYYLYLSVGLAGAFGGLFACMKILDFKNELFTMLMDL